jgi:hypothetical protein
MAGAILARTLAYQGDYPAAWRVGRAALAEAEATRATWPAAPVWCRAFVMRQLGHIARQQGDLATCRQWADRRRPLIEQTGDPWLRHSLLNDLAFVAYGEGDGATARRYLEDETQLSRAMATPRSIAGEAELLAVLCLDQGDLAGAGRYLREATSRFRELGDRFELVRTLGVAARLAAALSRPERALRLAGAAEALRAALRMHWPASGGQQFEQMVAAARSALGPAEQAAAWAAGQVMTLDAAVAEALDEEPEG